MIAKGLPLLLLAALAVAAAAEASGPPGTAAEVILSAPDREWIRVFEDGRFGAVHRFRPDGALLMIPPTRSSWRTWEIKDGRLLINGETPCDVVTTTVIRGVHDKGRFVLVPKAAEWEPPAADPEPRLTIRIFVDGTDHIFARGGRLWIVHEAAKRPGTEGGTGPAYVNRTAWIPEWEGNATKPFECLDPPLPAAGEHLFWVAKAKGRGTIRLNETPSPENDHVLSLTVEDAAPGAQWYELVVAW